MCCTMTSKMNKIDWTFENWCLVGLYLVIIFGAFYHLLYTLPKHGYHYLRYGPLPEEHIKKFGHDYSQLIIKDKQ